MGRNEAKETTARLLLHERTLADGGFERTWLEVLDGEIALRVDEDTAVRLDVAVLEAVMKRYGKPLADDVVGFGPTLDLGAGRTACVLRHRARYDVIARDFFVYRAPWEEPLAELATSVVAALA